jgi:signal transduction histidine kinase
MQLVIDGSIDSAQTVITCAQHQKAIVDDILTFSKLGSDLLSVTPVAADPQKIVREAIKIFAAESRRAGIRLSVAVDKSVDELKVNWVFLDPSRLRQVLINLLTNALKFTQTGEKREVTVTMSAFTERPSRNRASMISYIPTRSVRDDALPISSLHENPSPQYFLHFTVKDTGRGLTGAEKKLLFKRFSQASPRTHVQYGGSGSGFSSLVSSQSSKARRLELSLSQESAAPFHSISGLKRRPP